MVTPLQREGTSHRLYEEEAYERLEKVSALKQLGLSLEEIQDVIELYFESDDTHLAGKQKVIDILKTQLEKVDTQIDELAQFRSDLIRNIRHMESLYEEALKE